MSPLKAAELAVDVVITNHNYGRYLAGAIGSALGQTHPRVNVVVVDDGSSDESREVLDAFADRVDVVLKERGGQASALNAGIERCQGDVLLLLDADDVLRPEAAERVARAFEEDPELVKVQFRMAVIDAAGRPTGGTKPTGHLLPPTGDARTAELAFPFDIAWLPGGGTAFRTSLVRRILPIPEADYPHCGADWYLVHLSALLGPAAAIDEVCSEYRIHGENGYELDAPRLDLGHVRDSIRFARATRASLERLADEMGLPRHRPILSLSDLANRLISLKLDPRRHPVPDDTTGALLLASLHAMRRRFDVSWPMKALFFAWFLIEAAAPRRFAHRLGELFLFPERRRTFNRLLGRMQRSEGGGRVTRLS
ncbi:MAG TPA: glycosyltransferase family 2 protein [Solirubrobacterales bacterium]|jgi:glycosyltransferase involved in cell wall biosynthesis|nr:glycosyltransferase family 2 protein [Solirubrobacterales bacterium]